MRKFLFFFVGITFVGCSSTVSTTRGYAETIEKAHPDRIEKTVIGMDLNAFRTIWPKAARSGFSEGSLTYEFVYENLGPLGLPNGNRILTYFYFSNDKLVKYESTRRTL